MRTLPAIVIALVVGIVLGAWQPRGELLALRQQVDELRVQAAKPCRGRGLEQIRDILSPAEASDDAPTKPGRRRMSSRPPASTGTAREDDAVDGGRAAANGAPADPAKELGAAKAALDARRAHAMEALIEQGDLDEDDQTKINTILDDMNAKLKEQIDEFVADAQRRSEVERRDFLELGADALDVVLASDDALRESLTAEVYEGLDDELTDPLSYVSGSTIDGVVALAGLPGFEQP